MSGRDVRNDWQKVLQVMPSARGVKPDLTPLVVEYAKAWAAMEKSVTEMIRNYQAVLSSLKKIDILLKDYGTVVDKLKDDKATAAYKKFREPLGSQGISYTLAKPKFQKAATLVGAGRI